HVGAALGPPRRLSQSRLHAAQLDDCAHLRLCTFFCTTYLQRAPHKGNSLFEGLPAPLWTHGGDQALNIPIISPECAEAGGFLRAAGTTWADGISLAARDSAEDLPLEKAIFESFRIRMQGYVDKDALQEFLVGPGSSIKATHFHTSRSGLLHHMEQTELLAHLMESTPGCKDAKGAAEPADVATSEALQARFGGGCRKVAQKLRNISTSYSTAFKRAEETNKGQ
ncbi:unnamed protein product, partial [Polarella glacialis]